MLGRPEGGRLGDLLRVVRVARRAGLQGRVCRNRRWARRPNRNRRRPAEPNRSRKSRPRTLSAGPSAVRPPLRPTPRNSRVHVWIRFTIDAAAHSHRTRLICVAHSPIESA